MKFNEDNSSKVSHIGIALSNTKKSLVYNISYDKKNKKNSSLIEETFTSFWNSVDNSDNKLWKIKVSRKEYHKIKKYIESLENEHIFFDLDSSTSNGLYCSEFVYSALIHSGNTKFILKKKEKKLVGISRIIVGKDIFQYYPADFFLNYDFIQK